jgi:hypothetical protein
MRVIDADGHVIEDMWEITARMPQPYRKLAERNGAVFPPLDHLHDARAVKAPPQREGRKRFRPRVGSNFSTMSRSTGRCSSGTRSEKTAER